MVLPRVSFAIVLMLWARAPLLAQAPRETAAIDLGGVQTSVEYGSPPWREERRGQIDRMLPVGGVWRLGADVRTTLLVKGGAILIGDTIIEDGGYGLNLRRTAEKQWAFVVYDGNDTTVAPDDPEWEIPAQLVDATGDESPARLVVAFEEVAGSRSFAVRWGPLALHAPVATIETRESELELGGEQASARWFVRSAGSAPRPGAWIRVGSLGSFFVADVDCAMDVHLRLDGGKARVRMQNRDRTRLVERLARVESELAQATGGAGTRGTPAARFNTDVKRFADAKAKLEQEIADLGAAPQPYELEVVLQPAKEPSGHIAVEFLRRDGRLVVTVDAFDRSGESAIDEAKLLPAPPAGGK
jgi:hypothetical protein